MTSHKAHRPRPRFKTASVRFARVCVPIAGQAIISALLQQEPLIEIDIIAGNGLGRGAFDKIGNDVLAGVTIDNLDLIDRHTLVGWISRVVKEKLSTARDFGRLVGAGVGISQRQKQAVPTVDDEYRNQGTGGGAAQVLGHVEDFGDEGRTLCHNWPEQSTQIDFNSAVGIAEGLPVPK